VAEFSCPCAGPKKANRLMFFRERQRFTADKKIVTKFAADKKHINDY
jgi:hypothetical protein